MAKQKRVSQKEIMMELQTDGQAILDEMSFYDSKITVAY